MGDKQFTKTALKIRDILDAPIAFGRPANEEEIKVFADKKYPMSSLYAYGFSSGQRFVVHMPYTHKPTFIVRPMLGHNLLSSLRELHWSVDPNTADVGENSSIKLFFGPGRNSKGVLEEIMLHHPIWERVLTAHKSYMMLEKKRQAAIQEIKKTRMQAMPVSGAENVTSTVTKAGPQLLVNKNASSFSRDSEKMVPVFRKKLPNRKLRSEEIKVYTLLDSDVQSIRDLTPQERKVFRSDKQGMLFKCFTLKSGQSFAGCITGKEALFKPLNNFDVIPHLQQVHFYPEEISGKMELGCSVLVTDEGTPKENFLYSRIFGPRDGQNVIPHSLSVKTTEIQSALMEIEHGRQIERLGQEKLDQILAPQKTKKLIQQKLNERRQNG